VAGRPRLLAGHRRCVVRRTIDVSWEICEYFLSARVTWSQEQGTENNRNTKFEFDSLYHPMSLN
jgi:hypothetical protein